jgi:uncharacterized protein (DUF2062 family)
VAAFPGLVAHGGLVGAIVESLLVVAVTSVFVAVWIRERRARREQSGRGPAALNPDE